MKTFEKFPKTTKCPICGTNENKICVLIAKSDKIEGNIAEAQCYHLDCIELLQYIKGNDIVIAHSFEVKK